MRLLICPGRRVPPQGVESIRDEAPAAAKLRLTHWVLSTKRDTEVEVRSCISGNNLIRASEVLFAQLVVDVDSGYF